MTVACFLILAPFLLLSSMVVIKAAFLAGRSEDEQQLHKIAGGIADQMRNDADWHRSLPRFINKIPDLKPRGIAIQVVDVEQGVVWRSQADTPPWPSRTDSSWMTALAKVPPQNLVVVGRRRWENERELAYHVWGLHGLSLLVLLLVASGAWLLVGRTLLPIRLLASQAGAASTENLHIRLKAPSRDAEIVELVQTLNGLLSRLSDTAAAKGRFYAAASHELRTPLQALSGHLELALSRPRTAQEYEVVLQEAHRQTGRLTSLVRDLLLLHQLDTASSALGAEEPVDLAEVCQQVLCPLEPLVEARGLYVRTELALGAQIHAIPTHAEILVRNLVENAVKYARPGGAVTLRLVNTTTPRLEVFNECQPLPEGDPQKLFEPFYRPDAARNRKTGGNGLGLAICRAIAAANGWTVTLLPTLEGVQATACFGTELGATK